MKIQSVTKRGSSEVDHVINVCDPVNILLALAGYLIDNPFILSFPRLLCLVFNPNLFEIM